MPRESSTPAGSGVVPTASIFLAAALALAGALDYYQYLSNYSRSPDNFQIVTQQQRLRDAVAALPASGTVAYLSDVASSGGQGQVMFGIAQYELAPRVLVPLRTARNAEWVLGNFANPPDAPGLAARHGLRVISDYGNGVVLFRREAGR